MKSYERNKGGEREREKERKGVMKEIKGETRRE
jgi:hypothetical protein